MNSEQFIKSVENGEYPINKELLDNLYLEQEDLLKKMAKYRDKGDVGTYKNLVRSLADVTALIDNMWRNTPIKPIEKWQEKFSHYHSDGKELISTWEQKGEDIRNEKVYEVKEVVEQNNNKYLYFELSRSDKGYNDCDLFYNDKVIRLRGVSIDHISNFIANIVDKENTIIYGDTRNFAMCLYDSLIANGFNVKHLNIVTKQVSF